MKVFKALPILTCLVSISAFAAKPNLQPELGEKACFERQYTAEHMRANPNQKLSSMYVFVEHTRETYEGGSYDLKSAKVVGKSKNEFYMNDQAGCDYKADGSISCAIECDGGAFNVRPRNGNVLFSVNEDYYFPLYKNGKDQETAEPEDTLSLEANDKDNAAYKLYPVEPVRCEEALARAKTGNWGC